MCLLLNGPIFEPAALRIGKAMLPSFRQVSLIEIAPLANRNEAVASRFRCMAARLRFVPLTGLASEFPPPAPEIRNWSEMVIEAIAQTFRWP
jgi:hypothetical protein